MNDTVITLIAQTVSTENGGFEKVTEVSTSVFGEIRSVTRQEFYQSVSAGVRADIVIRMRAADYTDQQEFELDNKRYSVIRTYTKDGEWLEITGHRK